VPGEYVACPQATAAVIFPPASVFVCVFGNQRHFAYVDAIGNIQDCWYDGDANRWNLQQINNFTEYPSVPGEYVACPQATAAAPTPAAPSLEPPPPAGLFVCVFGNQQHFAYVDDNGNIQDCWYDGDANRWNLQQINNAAGQPSVPGEYVACPQATAAAAFVFVNTFGNQQHFAFSGDSNIQDCWWG